MLIDEPTSSPDSLDAIEADTRRLGFTLASEPRTGALLRALAASKPGARILELGTGTGVGTAWILSGMDQDAHLTSVDSDAVVLNVARRHLGSDPRVAFRQQDGSSFLAEIGRGEFDIVYADAWPGKFVDLELALAAVKVGGIYFVDDLSPQPSWPEGHAPKVPRLIAALEQHSDFVTVILDWASGLAIAVRMR